MNYTCAMTSWCCEVLGRIHFIRGSAACRQRETGVLALLTERRLTGTASHGVKILTGFRTWSDMTVVGEVVLRWLWPERAARADTSLILQ